jgi:hypothetical protein
MRPAKCAAAKFRYSNCRATEAAPRDWDLPYSKHRRRGHSREHAGLPSPAIHRTIAADIFLRLAWSGAQTPHQPRKLDQCLIDIVLALHENAVAQRGFELLADAIIDDVLGHHVVCRGRPGDRGCFLATGWGRGFFTGAASRRRVHNCRKKLAVSTKRTKPRRCFGCDERAHYRQAEGAKRRRREWSAPQRKMRSLALNRGPVARVSRSIKRVQTPSFRARSSTLGWLILYPPILKSLRKSRKHLSFNHGVEGSSPSALTKKLNDIKQIQFPNLFSLACGLQFWGRSLQSHVPGPFGRHAVRLLRHTLPAAPSA